MENNPTSAVPKQYLTFTIGGQNFATEAGRIRAILTHRELMRIPGSDPDVAGLVQINGLAIVVFDLRTRLDLSQTRPSRTPQVVAFEKGSGELAAFVADRISDVVTFRNRDLRLGAFRGMGRPRRLIEPDKLISSEELLRFWQTNYGKIRSDAAVDSGPALSVAQRLPKPVRV